MPYPHLFIKLTAEERERIVRELRALNMAGQFRRRKGLQSIYLSDSGLNLEQISKRLKVTYRTVQNWFHRYRKEGMDGFRKHEK